MARTNVNPLWNEIHEALNQVRFSIWALENGVEREFPRSDLAQRLLGEVQVFIQQENNLLYQALECQSQTYGGNNNNNLEEVDREESNVSDQQVERLTVRYLGVALSPNVGREDNFEGESDSSVPELEERPYNSRPERETTLAQRLRNRRGRRMTTLGLRENRRIRRTQRRFH